MSLLLRHQFNRTSRSYPAKGTAYGNGAWFWTNKRVSKDKPGETHAVALFSPRHTVPLAIAASVALLVVSYEIRKWRDVQVYQLALVFDEWNHFFPSRGIESVIPLIERCGLMGRTPSVRTDLEFIRSWHQQNGYTGGLILRDLSLPPFAGQEDADFGKDNTNDQPFHSHSLYLPKRLNAYLTDQRQAQSDCYYLYYEIKGDGEHLQQIFCRGTTLLVDVVTCLQAWMVFDPELQCRVHRGFCTQADRILQDVIPLLTPPSDKRGTVEVCGHSLGGAVAVILAAKLKKRGYQIARVTTVASPRFCATETDAHQLRHQLPSDYLRIEHDLDVVPFLPFFGAHLGNKMWLLHDAGARLVNTATDSWTDSVWINFLLWDKLKSKGESHRVRSHVQVLKNSLITRS